MDGVIQQLTDETHCECRSAYMRKWKLVRGIGKLVEIIGSERFVAT